MSSFSRENTGRYISALTNDCTAIETDWLNKQFSLVTSLISCVGALCMMVYYSPLLSLCTVALALLPLTASILTGSRLAREEKAVSEENERFVDTVKDLLSGFTVIKSFKAESQAQGLFFRRNREVEGVKRRRRTVAGGGRAGLGGGCPSPGVCCAEPPSCSLTRPPPPWTTRPPGRSPKPSCPWRG